MQFNAQSARNYLSNRKRATKDIDTPWWSEKDADGNEIGLQGHVQIRKLSAGEGFDVDKIEDDGQRGAFILSKALILKDTGEPLFEATGLSMTLDIDLDASRKLAYEIKVFNGLIPGAFEEKKESSSQAPESVPSTN